ncbi:MULTISPECIES: DUF4124 domain-containing protein [unclassified Hydrogenophaga]|uniref:DUF4124 domain-containing protein n=1 Tax=unclassified Hydrogenophaga TaxID=2610897 RepID=UPI000A421DB4|nr:MULTISPECIES: DUF4124 domain-containing protein [unclassified Hydrogenophaga]MBN9370246.1 DUF4124 domain-containing protein [Hydrogenophaga sp.]
MNRLPLPMPLPRRSRLAGAAALLLLSLGAQAQNNAQSIYTCTDSKGRRITSDRPIVDCLDREQQRLGRTGTVREVIPPSYTREEREKVEAKRRAEQEEQARVQEERRRERALLIRYPNQGVHDKERQEALAQIDDVIAAVHKREAALIEQRKGIAQELEFYQGDLTKAPLWLRRKVEDNDKQMDVQKRFLVDQTQEKQRVNARFDEELAKLKQLWAAQSR